MYFTPINLDKSVTMLFFLYSLSPRQSEACTLPRRITILLAEI